MSGEMEEVIRLHEPGKTDGRAHCMAQPIAGKADFAAARQALLDGHR